MINVQCKIKISEIEPSIPTKKATGLLVDKLVFWYGMFAPTRRCLEITAPWGFIRN
jgi:hypothetical protein